MTKPRQRPRSVVVHIGAVAALLLVALAACAGPRTATLTVFHTNDIHAHLERRNDSVGAAEVAGVIVVSTALSFLTLPALLWYVL